MTETAIITRGDVKLAAYGDIEDVRELTRRILTMLPGAKDLGPYGAGALAQASLAMGLNPLIGEVWAIPQGGRQNDGTHKSYAIMVGIKGLRAKAHDQAKQDHGMFTVHFRSPTEDEMYGVKLNNGDIARACDLVVSGDKAERHRKLTGEVPRYVGIGIYKGGESTKMHPLQVARKRAEADAIKQAYDVPLSFVSGGAQQVDIEVEDEPEQYEENGDGLIRGNAQDAIDDLYGEYVEEGGYTGAAPGPDTREDLRADESRRAPAVERATYELFDTGHAADIAEAQRELDSQEPARSRSRQARPVMGLEDADLDYVPAGIDDWGVRMWGKLYFEAKRLGFSNDFHVQGALAKVYNLDKWDESKAEQSYREAWHLLQEHQRSKQAETA